MPAKKHEAAKAQPRKAVQQRLSKSSSGTRKHRGRTPAKGPVGRSRRHGAEHEHRRSELKALRQQYDELRRTLYEIQSIAHLGTWDWDLRTGRERWSEEQYRLFGYEPGEIEPSHKAFLNLVHPDDRKVVEKLTRDAIDNPRSWNLEFRLIRRDGVMRWMRARGQVYCDKNKRPVRLAGTEWDITEYKLAQEALRESAATARALLNAPTDSVVLIDRQGTILDINEVAARRFGGTADGLIGTCGYDLAGLEVVERRKPLLFEVFESGKSVRSEDERAGLWFDTVYYPVLDSSGKVTRLAVVARDITERKRAEEEQDKLRAQLLHAQKLESLGILTGGIAHDFNNLLMAILGNADLALLGLAQDSAVRSSLEEILKVSRRAADLVKQLLDYSGKGQILVQPVDLGELIREITDMLKLSISKRAILKLDLARNLPRIEADPSQVRQLMMNLIINASDAFGDNSGAISISTGSVQCDRAYLSGTLLGEKLREGLYVYLEVGDTGCGMNDETLGKMFDPFFTTKFAGRGLGLAVVFGIVRGHRGAIQVRSERGRGTTFRVIFPASLASAEKVTARRTKPVEWRGHGTVLLVDDEEIIRIPARRMLELLGFRVLTAGDGLQALDMFKAHANEIVCVVLDLTMPRMDGEKTLGKLHRIKRDVPVIMTSGYGESEISRRFSRQDVAGFLQKPYQLKTLAEKIRDVLARGNSVGSTRGGAGKAVRRTRASS